ncbi:hypothetical protein SELMODRAFT_18284, partial [Selaginella moellendorffii]
EDSMGIFRDMELEGDCAPDAIFFLSILNASRQQGLVDQASHFFTLMSAEHGILPWQEHYNAMVDTLGRAGRIAAAEELINNMPFESQVATWGSLLTSCKRF